MGAGPEAFAGIGMSILGGIVSGSATQETSEAQVQALEAQKKQEEVAELSRSVKRLDNLKTVVGSNLALAGARGISPASGSFKAIEGKSFDEFNEDENLDKLNLAYKEQFISQEEAATREEARAREVGGFFQSVESIFKFL